MSNTNLPEFDGIQIISFTPKKERGFYTKADLSTGSFMRRIWNVRIRNNSNERAQLYLHFNFVDARGITIHKTYLYFPNIEPHETVEQTLKAYSVNNGKASGKIYLKRFQIDRGNGYIESPDNNYLVGEGGPIRFGIGCLIGGVVLLFVLYWVYLYLKSLLTLH